MTPINCEDCGSQDINKNATYACPMCGFSVCTKCAKHYDFTCCQCDPPSLERIKKARMSRSFIKLMK